MNAKLTEIELLLARIEQLAAELPGDPDGHVRRSTVELRSTFAERGAVEPAIARLRDGVVMLRRGNREGARREFQRRSLGIDHLQQVVEGELLPTLRRLGFEV